MVWHYISCSVHAQIKRIYRFNYVGDIHSVRVCRGSQYTSTVDSSYCFCLDGYPSNVSYGSYFTSFFVYLPMPVITYLF